MKGELEYCEYSAGPTRFINRRGTRQDFADVTDRVGLADRIDRIRALDYTRTGLPEWRNWHTRTTQNRVPLGGVRVQFPPSALAGCP
jgi:hypothetical protein